MSYDRQLDQFCTHEVVEEALFLSTDRLTIRPLRPISNVNSVKVRANGLDYVPYVGVQMPAMAKGSLPGPFTIRAGINDTLRVAVNDGPARHYVLPSGWSQSAQQLARTLTRLIGDLYFDVTKKGQITACTIIRGAKSRIQFLSGSTLAATLGLPLNRVYRGQQILPAWSLVSDPRTLSDRPTRLILFDTPVQGTNDFFELNYTTLKEECRRCSGSGVENDWRYDVRGEVRKARNSELLIQEALKATYTIKGTNVFHPWYGTNLLQMIGQKISDQGLVQNLILSDLQDAFSRWQSIKKQQEEVVGQVVSDEEYPFRLATVSLETDPNDPTMIFVNATVQNRANQPLEMTRGLKLPAPLDVLGSTVQAPLLQQA